MYKNIFSPVFVLLFVIVFVWYADVAQAQQAVEDGLGITWAAIKR